jgi:chemotaxis protein histidine kinase CheA
MLNVIRTKDGRYVRIRPFFGAELKKTKKPYRKVMRNLNALIKLIDKLPNSFDLLAKINEHKTLIYRANRNRTTTKEFGALLDEITQSETEIRRILDAYTASLGFEEVAHINSLWADVVAEWAEYIRVRAEAIREGLNVLQEAYKRALEENGIPCADVPGLEFKSADELDEETNPNADSPKAPYIWTGYFPLERKATLRHVLKYMSRKPIQDIALYCYAHGDYPKPPMNNHNDSPNSNGRPGIPGNGESDLGNKLHSNEPDKDWLDWLDQLINYKNQRCALGLARENYVLLDTLERFEKFIDKVMALKNKFEKLTAEHSELKEKLAPIAEKIAEIEKYVTELENKIVDDEKNAKTHLLSYADFLQTLLENVEQFKAFEAEELKEKQNRLAELNKQKAEIEAIRFECESIKREITQLEDWINSGIEREGDRERLAELQKKRAELEQKLAELSPVEEKIKAEMNELLKTLDIARQTVEFQEEARKAQTTIEEIKAEIKEDVDYCPVCGHRTAKPRYLTNDQLTEKVGKGLVLYYVDPETRRARLCVSSKAPNAREVVSYFSLNSYTARAMLELEKTRYADRIVSEWFVSEFSRLGGDKRANSG